MSVRTASLKRFVTAAALVGAIALFVRSHVDAQSGLPGLTDLLPHPAPTSGTYAYNSYHGPAAAGQSYVDPIFGSTVRRVTGDGQQDDIYGSNLHWNADETRYIHNTKVYNIRSGVCEFTVSTGAFNGDAGFDPVDPNAFFYLTGSTIHKVTLGNPGTSCNGATTDGVYLTAPSTVQSLGQSLNWLSADGQLMLVKYGSAVHIYDRANLAAGPFTGAPAGGSSTGYSVLTPSGRYVVAYGDGGLGMGIGMSWRVDAANRTVSTTPNKFWSVCGDHGAFASTSDGGDYFFTSDCYNNPYIMRVNVANNLADSVLNSASGEATQIAAPGNRILRPGEWGPDAHFTCAAKGSLKDWCFQSVEDHNDGFNGSPNWIPYNQEIVGYNLVTGEVRRLAHHRSRGMSDASANGYYNEPRVSASWGGAYVGWQSNFNQSGTNDTYVVEFGAASGGGGGGDTTPPTVSLTAPAAGNVTGTITVSANAADDTGVAGVQFKANGTNIGAEDTATPYSISWNTASVTDGVYSITATARDAAGNSTTSTGVSITIQNNGPVITAVAAGSLTPTSATISWTTSQAADSQVEYGTTTAYGSTTTLDSSLVTAHTQALSGLSSATTYHYRVKSRNVSAQLTNSSDFNFTTVGPPTISNIGVANPSGTSVQITWTTNQTADSQIEYGLTSAYGSSTTLDSSLVTSHSVLVSGLTTNTTYHYRVRSTNSFGLLGTSADGTFVATTPPVISAIAASAITGSGATITWTTDQASDTQVDYGTTTAYGSSTTLNTSAVTAHSVTLSGLSQGTLYHYRVKSRNPQGALATSADSTLTTASPATISAVASSNIGASTATVTWTTNQAADSQIDYGTTTAYGSTTTLDATLVTSHSQNLSGLNPGTTYNYRARSRNAAGILTTSNNFTFTTVGPPTISAVSATQITGTSTTIIWTTNQAADTQVDYGTTTAYGTSTTLNAAMSTTHSQALTGLAMGTLYHFHVKSRNAQSLLTTSNDFTFTTAAPPTISAVVAANISSTSATITWTTNQTSDSQVDWGTTASYGNSSTLDTLMVTSHGRALSGLSANTLYHFRVKSRNAVGLLTTSGDFTFSTIDINTNETVTVSKQGNGSGSVIGPLAGISCNGNNGNGNGTGSCSGSVKKGSQVTLTAMTAPGSQFGGWSGACTGMATSCTVTVNGATSVTARFNVGTAGDFDGDGFPDLVMQNADGSLTLWLMNGSTRLSVAPITPLVTSSGIDWQIINPGSPEDPTSGGGSGFQHPIGGQLSAVYLTTDARILDIRWKIAGTPDLDGNGRADLLWQNPVTGQLAAWIMDGAVKTQGNFLTPPSMDQSWTMSGTGDFNGDGKADILWKQNTGALLCWLMDGTTKIGEQSLLPGTIAANWRLVGTADFDGDGQADIVWQNSTTGDVYVWYMNGTSMRQEQAVGRFADGWTVRAVGDFDADGHPDLIWQKDTGELAVWFMNGLIQTTVTYLTPGSIDPSWTIMGPR